MSVYRAAVDAYRDTTKWLAAFVPVSALVTATVVIGPRLLEGVRGGPDASWLVVCGLMLLAAIAAVLWSAARVLSVEPADIGDLADATGRSAALAEAIGSGVVAPEFFTKEAFDEAMSELANAFDAGKPEVRMRADDARVVRLRTAVEALREWSVFRRVQAPYRTFQIVFVFSCAVILGTAVLISAQPRAAVAIAQPTKVVVTLSDEGVAGLRQATDCTAAASSTFVALGGSWDRPLLAVDGPGCRFGAAWRPTPEQAEIRLP